MNPFAVAHGRRFFICVTVDIACSQKLGGRPELQMDASVLSLVVRHGRSCMGLSSGVYGALKVQVDPNFLSKFSTRCDTSSQPPSA